MGVVGVVVAELEFDEEGAFFRAAGLLDGEVLAGGDRDGRRGVLVDVADGDGHGGGFGDVVFGVDGGEVDGDGGLLLEVEGGAVPELEDAVAGDLEVLVVDPVGDVVAFGVDAAPHRGDGGAEEVLVDVRRAAARLRRGRGFVDVGDGDRHRHGIGQAVLVGHGDGDFDGAFRLVVELGALLELEPLLAVGVDDLEAVVGGGDGVRVARVGVGHGDVGDDGAGEGAVGVLGDREVGVDSVGLGLGHGGLLDGDRRRVVGVGDGDGDRHGIGEAALVGGGECDFDGGFALVVEGLALLELEPLLAVGVDDLEAVVAGDGDVGGVAGVGVGHGDVGDDGAGDGAVGVFGDGEVGVDLGGLGLGHGGLLDGDGRGLVDVGDGDRDGRGRGRVAVGVGGGDHEGDAAVLVGVGLEIEGLAGPELERRRGADRLDLELGVVHGERDAVVGGGHLGEGALGGVVLVDAGRGGDGGRVDDAGDGDGDFGGGGGVVGAAAVGGGDLAGVGGGLAVAEGADGGVAVVERVGPGAGGVDRERAVGGFPGDGEGVGVALVDVHGVEAALRGRGVAGGDFGGAVFGGGRVVGALDGDGDFGGGGVLAVADLDFGGVGEGGGGAEGLDLG